MKMKLIYLVLVISLLFFGKLIGQSIPKLDDLIGQQLVIGFPSITPEQLNEIKAEFLTIDQISSANYVYNNHDVMLITFNTNSIRFIKIYDFLKPLNHIYPMDNCYFKPNYVYEEINNSVSKFTTFLLK